MGGGSSWPEEYYAIFALSIKSSAIALLISHFKKKIKKRKKKEVIVACRAGLYLNLYQLTVQT